MHESLVYDLPEAEYHADRDTLSVSGAKVLLKAPALFRWQQDHPVHKDVFDVGSAAHKLVLGVGDPIHPISADSWRSKAAQEERDAARAAGEIPLLVADHERVLAMAEALSDHETAMSLLSGGSPEVSAYATDPHTGVAMRCRFDYLAEAHAVDYKSTRDASPEGFARAVANFGYDMQDAWYQLIADQISHPLEAFCFIAQEKEPPYLVEVYELDSAFRRRGFDRGVRAREIYAECCETDDWSRGYTGMPYSTLYAPRWAQD